LLTQHVVLALLSAWAGGLIAFTFLEWRTLIKCTPTELASRAANLDRTGTALVPISICVACISLLVCLLETPVKPGHGAWAELLYIAHFVLVFVTIGASWMFVQTAFAVRYAHLYGTEIAGSSPRDTMRPLAFPGDVAPDGQDMLHFSVTIGVAAATADIDIQSRAIRRVVTLHAIYSYFFNACVLALVVNLTAAAL
jgi:uncharacterized membrane protein